LASASLRSKNSFISIKMNFPTDDGFLFALSIFIILQNKIQLFVVINKCFFNKIKISAAYKHADGKKIDGKRVLVDVERARTVKGWLSRRLGKLKLFYICNTRILMQLCRLIIELTIVH
jgi:hypothetical protein